jgi:aldehyde dehydrogenase (NAD+)
MKEIQLCMSEMREFFQTGTTLSVAWRKKQLKALKASITEHDSAILKALYEDLGKSDFEG